MTLPNGPLTPEQVQAFTLDTLVTLTDKVERIEVAMLGDKKFQTRGLIGDVRKIQKENQNSKKFQWTTGTTVMGILVKWFYHLYS
jgi:hypothetical protein